MCIRDRRQAHRGLVRVAYRRGQGRRRSVCVLLSHSSSPRTRADVRATLFGQRPPTLLQLLRPLVPRPAPLAPLCRRPPPLLRRARCGPCPAPRAEAGSRGRRGEGQEAADDHYEVLKRSGAAVVGAGRAVAGRERGTEGGTGRRTDTSTRCTIPPSARYTGQGACTDTIAAFEQQPQR